MASVTLTWIWEHFKYIRLCPLGWMRLQFFWNHSCASSRNMTVHFLLKSAHIWWNILLGTTQGCDERSCNLNSKCECACMYAPTRTHPSMKCKDRRVDCLPVQDITVIIHYSLAWADPGFYWQQKKRKRLQEKRWWKWFLEKVKWYDSVMEKI